MPNPQLRRPRWLLGSLGFVPVLMACGDARAPARGDAAPTDGEVVSDAGAAEAGGDATPDAMKAPCALTSSGPVVASADGQVIENLHIVTSGKSAITIAGKKNVLVRNVWIEHALAAGITLSNADGATIQDVLVEHTGAPPSGANDSADRLNIDCFATASMTVDRARLSRGSSGIYMDRCPSAKLTRIEGYDFRGPFPRGQLVQFNASDDGLLDGFSVLSGHTAWPEDNVNVYKSTNVTIRNGLIDGNNAPSGVGVIFDGDTGAGLVEDVDAIHMGNGCFSNYAGADGNTFRRVRCRENICTSQDGRGAPSSNALMFCGKPAGVANTRLEQAKYFASCNGNVSWPAQSFSPFELVKDDFTLRPAIKNAFCWQ